jgi:hypothetical protein
MKGVPIGQAMENMTHPQRGVSSSSMVWPNRHIKNVQRTGKNFYLVGRGAADQ